MTKKSRKVKVHRSRTVIHTEALELIDVLGKEEVDIEERKKIRNALYDQEGNLEPRFYSRIKVTEYIKRKKKK
jgi:hypothetical protein